MAELSSLRPVPSRTEKSPTWGTPMGGRALGSGVVRRGCSSSWAFSWSRSVADVGPYRLAVRGQWATAPGTAAVALGRVEDLDTVGDPAAHDICPPVRVGEAPFVTISHRAHEGRYFGRKSVRRTWAGLRRTLRATGFPRLACVVRSSVALLERRRLSIPPSNAT